MSDGTPMEFITRVRAAHDHDPPKPPTCASCVFAHTVHLHSTASYLSCRRYPPSGDSSPSFPSTLAENFCGEWHPK